MKLAKKMLMVFLLSVVMFGFIAHVNASEVLYLPFDTVYAGKPPFTPGWMGENMYLFYAQMNLATELVPGKVGNCFPFTGCNGVTVYDGDSTLDFGYDDFAISFWIKTDTFKAQATVLSKIGTNGIGYGFSLKYGRPCFYMCDTNYGAREYMSSSVVGLADGRWHHVAVYVDRGNNTGGKIYVDGMQHLTFNAALHTGSLSNSSHLYIGLHSYDPLISSKAVEADIKCNVKNFQGQLDEYRHFRHIPK